MQTMRFHDGCGIYFCFNDNDRRGAFRTTFVVARLIKLYFDLHEVT